MTESDKLQEALDRLIKKTRAGEIKWEETLPEDGFIVSFPTHSVKIGRSPNDTGLTVSLFDKNGAVFLEQTATSGGVLNPGGALLGRRILELYQVVQANTPRDVELDRLLEELA